MRLPSCLRSRRLALLAALLAMPASVPAQTDYYNTDAGRPVRTEDAYPIEYRAIEIQAAPLRLERVSGGVYHWSIEPELALGLFPRTQIEVGFPLESVDGGTADRASGLAGIELSVLYNFNVETSIPALALATSIRLPVGGLAPDDSYGSAKAILTKTFSWARVHVNGEYTFGPSAGSDEDASGLGELSRWMAGMAVDRAFPLSSMLVTAEVVAREPLHGDRAASWEAAAGTRYQLTPRLALDAGIGRRLSGDEQGWHITIGTAYALGLPWGGGRAR
ncbi:MAG TPA: hypothetical protein VJ803_10125 [Gemmatimonadaceae bacterium]|nr:hypothetical protein [Gemmatimonadaceae bacterium]